MSQSIIFDVLIYFFAGIGFTMTAALVWITQCSDHRKQETWWDNILEEGK